MTLPNFLGIGAPRSGSTWLYNLLRSHPDVYMSQRKEIYFFRNSFHKGLSEYEKFFPGEEVAQKYVAIGEFTPYYLYCNECPARIAQVPSIKKFLVILRNPVDRAFSQFGVLLKAGEFQGTFEDCLAVFWERLIEHGYYSRPLKEYFRHFDREQFLILIMEEAVNNAAHTKQQLGLFLGLNAAKFADAASKGKINKSYLPRYPTLSRCLEKSRRQLNRRPYLAWVVTAARNLRIDQLVLASDKSLPAMKPATRHYLEQLYHSEILALESLLGRELSCWRQKRAS
ncbi:MAG TPA: sulfotransferase [Anaerolineae bacterium]|nr:sulfotransferase [Anaerolineae bacterium]HMR66549.1 sulfotransferase [Anaerolineae bacterium]